METLGQRIRRLRQELRMKVPDLAKLVGLAPTTVYEIENGRQTETTKIDLFAKVLRTSTDYLRTGKPVSPAVKTVLRVEDYTPATWGAELSREGAEVGSEWMKLDEPMRGCIMVLIETLVAQQKKAVRPARAKKGHADADLPELRPRG